MWKWIKISNIGALLAFFLPWLTVSCSGTPIATATGWQLAFGGYGASHQLGANAAASPPPGNGWLILALLAILFGIGVSFLKQSKKRSIKAGWSAGSALAFIFVGTGRYTKAGLIAQASNSDNGFASTISQAGLAMVEITWEIGIGIVVIALVAAVIMSWIAYAEEEPTTKEGRAKTTEHKKINPSSVSNAMNTLISQGYLLHSSDGHWSLRRWDDHERFLTDEELVEFSKGLGRVRRAVSSFERLPKDG